MTAGPFSLMKSPTHVRVPPRSAIDRAIAVTCRAFDVTLEELAGPCRERDLVDARKFLARRLHDQNPRMSASHIARVLHRDHATILYYFGGQESR